MNFISHSSRKPETRNGNGIWLQPVKVFINLRWYESRVRSKNLLSLENSAMKIFETIKKEMGRYALIHSTKAC